MGGAGLDWKQLGFAYQRAPWRFQVEWRDGAWGEPFLTDEATLTLEEGATALHYGQECFEGLKAFSGPGGEALLFRPDRNAARMERSAARLLMPAPPPELFLRGVRACVDACREVLPPHGSGASLYLRPLLIGVGDNLGVRPAPRYLLRIFCSPVGPYFKGGLTGIKLITTEQDRVAPRGTGSFKVGGNYAAQMLLTRQAKERGFDEVLYLDPLEHRCLEEAGSANVFGLLPGSPATFVTPESASILPSITLDSLLVLAREELGLKVERRRIAIDEVTRFAEMGCAGTAAVITPVALVSHEGRETRLPAPGPLTKELYRLLTSIQQGALPDRRGWVQRVEPGAAEGLRRVSAQPRAVPAR
jgi:branched-chain amino acid aminotransferase